MTISHRAVQVMCATAIAITGAAAPSAAQVARQSFPIVFGSGAITGTLPFDEPFILTAPAAPSLLEVRMWIGSQLSADDCARLVPVGDLGARATRRTDAGPESADNSDDFRAAAKKIDLLKDALRQAKSQMSSKDLSAADRASATGYSARIEELLASARAEKRQLKIRMDPSAVWRRNGMDSVTTMALEVGSIEPNRDYTACLHLVRSPTDKEAKDFVTNATVKLTIAIKNYVKVNALANSARLDSLQALLISSLPRADSVEIDTHSILYRIADETAADKAKRLRAFNDFWSHNTELYLGRRDQITAADTDAGLLTGHLSEISWRTLGKLRPIADNPATVKAHSTKFDHPAQIASRVADLVQNHVEGSLFQKIGLGTTSLDDQSTTLGLRDLSTIWAADGLKAYDDSLKLAGDQLGQLIDFVAYAGTREDLLKGLGVTKEMLDTAVVQLAKAIQFVTLERNDLMLLANTLNGLAAGVTTVVQGVKTYDLDRIALRSTTSTTFQARAKMYVSLDAGLLWGSDVREIVPYLGVNLYARPVNKNAPLAGCWCGLSRFAATLGVTAASIKQEGRVNDLFNSHAVMLGLGARLTDYWRVTYGAVAVKYFPDGPLQRSRITARPVVASSLDLDVLSALGAVTSFLIPGLK